MTVINDRWYVNSILTIRLLWPMRHDSGISRAILRRAIRNARAWRNVA